MNKGMLSVGIILLSVIALLLLNVLSNYSTGGELDYYLVKETVDAAELTAVYLRKPQAEREREENLITTNH